MIYTDAERYGLDERTCLFPDASGGNSQAWCGYNTRTDHLTAVATLADSLEQFMRNEENLCTTCANEMARALGVPSGQRRRWVEDYADGNLADHVTEGGR